MPLRVSFELDEDDLKHFRLIMREARKVAARSTPEQIVASADELLARLESTRTPKFIRDRLGKLRIMIDMLVDHEWRLPVRDATRVLNALAYFCEPEDLIPDHIPGLGYLDDAIMIELVLRELRHEIDAYRDFCDYRLRKGPRTGVKTKSSDVTREKWLEIRREELQSRMRRRRSSTRNGPGGGPPAVLT